MFIGSGIKSKEQERHAKAGIRQAPSLCSNGA